jgi:hypothetical protein
MAHLRRIFDGLGVICYLMGKANRHGLADRVRGVWIRRSVLVRPATLTRIMSSARI